MKMPHESKIEAPSKRPPWRLAGTVWPSKAHQHPNLRRAAARFELTSLAPGGCDRVPVVPVLLNSLGLPARRAPHRDQSARFGRDDPSVMCGRSQSRVWRFRQETNLMNSQQGADQAPKTVLNVLCMREDGAWRVLLGDCWCPQFLRECFDEDGEAPLAVVDFDDLNSYMQKRRAPYEKRPSKLGDMELKARGYSATQLAFWLASAFAANNFHEGPANGKRA